MKLVRHCAHCDTDYLAHVTVCADCGGPLEERLEGAVDAARATAPPQAPPPSAPPPPGDYETLYYSYDAADLTPLAERLRERGIPFQLQTLTVARGRRLPTFRYELTVREAERQSAREELLHLLDSETPPDAARSLDRDFDPETGYRRCPGCSADLGGGESSCPECGLALGDDPAGPEAGQCRCGMDLGPHDEECPRCGGSSPG
jgi:hypothetical protein